jgi:alcohol dehydrogenase, propanol-preferring
MVSGSMRGWVVRDPRPVSEHPLSLEELPVPEPAAGEVRIAVSTCGVCRTDLHVVEGDLEPRHTEMIPGHEVVGTVAALGPGAGRFARGDRVGLAWLYRSCGRCRYCRRGSENLCLEPRFTGWTEPGGYAEYVVADEAFLYRLPEGFDDVHAAPLLCAGIIGYRALKRARVPDGGRLGLYGFGASAHITAQIAVSSGAEVHVVTRSEAGRELALELGAVSAGGPEERPPTTLDSAIIFAPAGELVPAALEALDRGGTVALAGIHMSEIPALDHARHLFQERDLRTVTANTRADGEALLRLAARIGVRPEVTTYPFSAADRALEDLAGDRYAGVAVLTSW